MKPVFPEMPKSSEEVQSLLGFVRPSSWLFFQALNCNGSFLRKVSCLNKLVSDRLVIIC